MRNNRDTLQSRGRQESYGQRGLTPVDRFGVLLSRRPVMQVIQRYRRPTVLDIGCGYDASLLRSLLPDIEAGVGVDVAISNAAKHEPGLTFFEQPIAEAMGNIAGRRFDVILLISVLEHLWNPAEILRECYDLLRPQGAIVINVPNWLGKEFLEFSAFRLKLSPATEMDDHKMYYDKRDLWPLLVRAGFQPSNLDLRYHKFRLNLFAVARKA